MATKKVVKKSASVKKALPKKAGPRPPKDESRKPLNDKYERWFRVSGPSGDGYASFPRSKGNRMTKEQRQRAPHLATGSLKTVRDTKRKER